METTLNRQEILAVSYYLHLAIQQQDKPDEEIVELVKKLDNLPRECNTCKEKMTRYEYITGLGECNTCDKENS